MLIRKGKQLGRTKIKQIINRKRERKWRDKKSLERKDRSWTNEKKKQTNLIDFKIEKCDALWSLEGLRQAKIMFLLVELSTYSGVG